MIARFRSVTARQHNHDELDAIISDWTRQHDRYHIMRMLQAEGIAASPVFDGRDIHLDPHFQARGFLEKVPFPLRQGDWDSPPDGAAL